jgi:hypothetical protein
LDELNEHFIESPNDLTENITENDKNFNTNDDEDVHSLELNEDFIDFSIDEISEE